MASIRQAAQDVLFEAKDGIAWIALWKNGRSWNAMTFWPDLDRTGHLHFDDYELDQLRHIAEIDPNAIFVNAWQHNLGELETMTRDSLAEALRWQYEDVGQYLVEDAIPSSDPEAKQEEEKKYFYDMSTVPDHNDPCEYYTDDEIQKIRIVEVNETTYAESEREDSSLWPVHDIDRPSWEFALCKNIDEARDYVGRSLNQSVYEYIHDI